MKECVQFNGIRHEVVKFEDAKEGDFLERGGFVLSSHGWIVPACKEREASNAAIAYLIDVYGDRILRPAPEQKVWYGELSRSKECGNGGDFWWTHDRYKSLPIGTYDGKLWAKGTREPLPEWAKKWLESMLMGLSEPIYHDIKNDIQALLEDK